MSDLPCVRPWCVALAMPGQTVCVVHRQWPEYRPKPKIRTLQRLYDEEEEERNHREPES